MRVDSGESQLAVHGAGARSVEKEHEGDDQQGERVLGASVPVVAVDHDDGNEHVDGDQKRRQTGQEAKEDQDSAEELGEGGDDTEPVRKTEGGDKVAVVFERGEGIAAVESAMRDDLVPSVIDHGGPEDETQKEGTPGLQVIE